MVKNAPRYRQNVGYASGSVIAFAVVSVLLFPGQERFHVRGPLNVGHEELACRSCHKPAPGTFRQQVQASLKYFVGLRKSEVDFGHLDVDNMICLSCHERPNDNHPVFRFVEPRFMEARENIQPQFCVSCHLEHTGKRVTSEPTICVYCHQDLKLKNDPITTSHEALISAQRWLTCLGCHDWHGNHVMKLNESIDEAIDSQRVLEYFNGGESPYSNTKFYPAKKEDDDEY